MKIGCCSIKFFLHGTDSLNGKRRITKSIKDRVRNKFNISIAEIGDQDVWQNLHIGIVAVGSDHKYLDGLMSKIVESIDKMNLAEITDCQFETIHLGALNPK